MLILVHFYCIIVPIRIYTKEDDYMRLGDIVLYPIQVVINNEIIFDDVADNLPNELKDYEITDNVDYQNNKLILEVKPE